MLTMSEELANDYAAFMKLDVKNELRAVDDTVDDMLTRLDEFENLLNMVQSDGAMCTDGALPKVAACKPGLDKLFSSIDRLEKFVNRVENDVSRVDAAVVLAESDLAGPSSGKISAYLKPLFFKKSADISQKRATRQAPACDLETLYNTSDFFPTGQDALERHIQS